MNQIQKHNLHNIKRSFEKRTGTRLLTTEDTYAEEVDRSSNQKSKQHPFKIVVPIILCVIVLAGCLLISLPQLHSLFDPNDSTGSNPSLSESQVPSGSENEEEVDGTKPTESLGIDDYNMQIVRESNGMTVSADIYIEEMYVNQDLTLDIDAEVNTENVERVSMYAYYPLEMTDELRLEFFDAYFQDRADEVFRYTYGNATYHWMLKTEDEEYHYSYGLQQLPVTQSNYSVYDRYMVYKTLYVFPPLNSVGFSLDSALDKCAPLLDVFAKDTVYRPYVIRPCGIAVGNNESAGYGYWITYRRIVDGMPVAASLDMRFCVSKEKVFYMCWTIYDIEEIPLTQKIIGVDEALRSLQDNTELISRHSLGLLPMDVLPIREVTLEYIVLRGDDCNGTVTPVWRFLVGENDEQKDMFRDRIIAVNALTGEPIIEAYR